MRKEHCWCSLCACLWRPSWKRQTLTTIQKHVMKNTTALPQKKNSTATYYCMWWKRYSLRAATPGFGVFLVSLYREAPWAARPPRGCSRQTGHKHHAGRRPILYIRWLVHTNPKTLKQTLMFRSPKWLGVIHFAECFPSTFSDGQLGTKFDAVGSILKGQIMSSIRHVTCYRAWDLAHPPKD